MDRKNGLGLAMTRLYESVESAVNIFLNTSMDIRSIINLLEAAQNEPAPAPVAPEAPPVPTKPAKATKPTPALKQPLVPLLVLTHPGSACGSADNLLGRFDGRAGRDGLKIELDHWRGHILVADGELSEEIPDYPTLATSLDRALAQAARDKLIAKRVFACDNLTPNWPSKVAKTVKAMKLPPETPITVSGAWHCPGEAFGCVNATARALSRAGFTQVHISDYAVIDPGDGEDEDDD
jgi:hypothetical protein